MSTYNINTKQSFSYNTNSIHHFGLVKFNKKYSYNNLIHQYFNSSHLFLFTHASQLNPSTHSNIKSNPLVNLWHNPDILLSRLGMPVHNSAPGWRLK